MNKGQANGRPMELEPHLTLYLQENTNSYITLLTNYIIHTCIMPT